MQKNELCKIDMSKEFSEINCYNCFRRMGENRCELGNYNYSQGLMNSWKISNKKAPQPKLQG